MTEILVKEGVQYKRITYLTSAYNAFLRLRTLSSYVTCRISNSVLSQNCQRKQLQRWVSLHMVCYDTTVSNIHLKSQPKKIQNVLHDQQARLHKEDFAEKNPFDY